MYDMTGAPLVWSDELRAEWAAAQHDASLAEDVWSTPRSRGDPELRDALANFLCVHPDSLIVTSGVRPAVIALSPFFSEILLERPTFAEVPALFRSLGLSVSCQAWSSLALCRPSRPNAMFWVTSPARNPDGATIGTHLVKQLQDTAESSRSFLILNETYLWYSDWKPPEGCTRVGSFSKLVGGGARLGWVINPPQQAEVALARIGPATLWQRAWALFLKRTSRQRLLDGFIRPVNAARNTFLAASGDAAVTYIRPSAGPSALVALGEAVSEQEAVSFLSARGILAGLGSDFLAEEPSIRIAFTGLDRAKAAGAGQTFRALLDERPTLIRTGTSVSPGRLAASDGSFCALDS
jgi:2-aminoadipate transaminase